MAVAGLMHGYLKHLGIDNDLVHGIFKQYTAGYGIAHVWVEVGGEPVETTFVEVVERQLLQLQEQGFASGFHTNITRIYQKGQVCVIYILCIISAVHPLIKAPPPSSYRLTRACFTKVMKKTHHGRRQI